MNDLLRSFLRRLRHQVWPWFAGFVTGGVFVWLAFVWSKLYWKTHNHKEEPK